MFKWLLGLFFVYFLVGIGIRYFSFATPISEQIDVKAMSFTKPNYIYKTYSECIGDCRNYSSNSSSSSRGSSWGGGSSGGK